MPIRPNLLMICVDDLAPLLGCHGHTQMHTPHIDRLAASGTRFENAYCQVPVCGASRASLLTGLRPTRERFKNFSSRADEEAPHAPTLPGFFRERGYRTAGTRKVFHNRYDHQSVWDEWFNDGLPSFPGRYYTAEAMRAYEASETHDDRGKARRGPAYEVADIPDDAHHDGLAAEWAVKQLKTYARHREVPFLLCFGSVNVHLPFTAPQKYWDLYDPDSLPFPDHKAPPPALPEASVTGFGELRNYTGIPATGPVDDTTARHLIHGYRAGVSYLDAQVGKLLDTLDENGLTQNTIVALWVDHGWTLGHAGQWCKHTLRETSLHVPLILRGPGIPPGTVVAQPVANLDLFPTLCDVMILEGRPALDGTSLCPSIHHPDEVDPDARVFSRYGSGDSVRTPRFRYTQWTRSDDASGGVGLKRYAHTLFDLTADPGELHNLADDPAHAETIESLAIDLARWRDADRGNV